jgi:tartrate-resistant acid phosphatase type 5
MATNQRRFEPFVHVVDVTADAAMVAWGGFFHDMVDGRWQVVDDDDLDGPRRGRGGSIGATSPAYGSATVEVLGPSGCIVATASRDDANHVVVHGLAPDTEHTYRITVDGRPWADGGLREWVVDGDRSGPEPMDRRYDCRFRTHPAENDDQPVTLLVWGDYGVGIDQDEDGRRQHGVARTMERLAARHPVRALVSLGDNIYHRPSGATTESGDEDDDWYLTFYEPYRFLIDHLPVYPAAGNHDGSDEEASDDRAQLADNFHLEARFGAGGLRGGHASMEPGLFYRASIGALVDLVCIDTTWGEREGEHRFDDDEHRAWLEQVLVPRPWAEAAAPWRLPFCHHPAFGAGPHHDIMREQVDALLPLYDQGAVRLLMSGHEHNFQHGRTGTLDHLVSGASAKLDERTPTRCQEAGTLEWAAAAHCLLVDIFADRIAVTPYGATEPGQEPQPIPLITPAGDPAPSTITIAAIP